MVLPEQRLSGSTQRQGRQRPARGPAEVEQHRRPDYPEQGRRRPLHPRAEGKEERGGPRDPRGCPSQAADPRQGPGRRRAGPPPAAARRRPRDPGPRVGQPRRRRRGWRRPCWRARRLPRWRPGRRRRGAAKQKRRRRPRPGSRHPRWQEQRSGPAPADWKGKGGRRGEGSRRGAAAAPVAGRPWRRRRLVVPAARGREGEVG